MSVFSNGDPQSLNNAVTGLSIPVDRAISAEQDGYYKSDSRAYNHTIKELGMPGAQAVYVADHAWDIRCGRAAGMAGLAQTVKRLPSLISTTRKLIWKFRGRRD